MSNRTDLQSGAGRAVDERYRALFEHTAVGIVIVGLDGRITEANPAFLKMLGYSLDELRHLAYADYNHPDDQPREHTLYDELLAGVRHQYEIEKHLIGKDGRAVRVQATVSLVGDDSGTPLYTIWTVLPDMQRKEAEQPPLEGEHRYREDTALREQTRTLEVINRVNAKLAAELDLEKLVQSVTDAGTELTGAEFGAFFYNVVDTRGESYMLYTLSGAPREAFSRYPMPRSTAVFHPTFHNEGVVRSDDITKDPRYGQNPPYYGMPEGHLPVRSYLAVSVVSRTGEVIGGLFFGHQKPGVFTEQAERIVVSIADQAAIAVENARLFQAAQRELTERRRTEQALIESEERLRLAQHAGRIGIFDWDLVRGESTWSDTLWDIVGMEPTTRQIPPDIWSMLAHPDDAEDVIASARAAIASGQPYESEFRVRRPDDGAIVWLASKGQVIYDEEGRPVRMLGVNIDITGRKRAEETVRFLAKASLVLASSLDYETTLNSVAGLVVPEWADWCAISLLDESGTLQNVAVVHADPSKIQWARELQHRYPTRMDAPTGAPNVIRTGKSEIYPDIPDELLRASAMDEEHYRILKDVGMRSAIVAPLTARGRTFGAITLIAAEYEHRYDEDDLPFVEELARMCALAVENARLYGEAQHEIEERRRAEEEVERLNHDLQRRVEELETVFDVTPVGFGIAEDPACERIRVNPAFAQMLGIDPHRNASKTSADDADLPFQVYKDGREVPPAELPMQHAARHNVIIRGEEYEIVCADGRKLTLLEYASPLYDEKGKVRGSLGAFVDITELKQTEIKLKQFNETLEQRVVLRTAELERANTQLRAEIGERRRAEQALERTNDELVRRNRELQDFAYVASHDLQEPLRKIHSFADLLNSEYASTVDEEGRLYLDRIQNAATRMSRLIYDLLQFSRVATKGEPFTKVDLNRIVAEVLSDLETRINDVNGTVQVGALPEIEADPTQMRQLFQNLIGNALKFHKPDDPPIVRVTGTVQKSPQPRAGIQQFCRLEVQDNGIGFEEKYLDRIFSPFQRLHNREDYAGTGMGLAIVRRIVERHHGTVTARSKPGEGATFIVALPVEQVEEPAEAEPVEG